MSQLRNAGWVVFIVAVVIRLTAVTWWLPADAVPVGDALQYDLMAQRLLRTGELEWVDATQNPPLFQGPTIRRTPLYPGFLAGVYALVGHSLSVVRAAQCVLSAFSDHFTPLN